MTNVDESTELSQPRLVFGDERSARPTRSILLCVDGSSHAHAAARTLAGLPWMPDTRITLLGIRDRHSDPDPGIEQAVDTLHAAGARLLGRRLVDAIPRTGTFDVRSAVLATIAELEPDIVAFGSRGLGGSNRLALGSTASAVIHHAPCSVLVVRAERASQPDTSRPR